MNLQKSMKDSGVLLMLIMPFMLMSCALRFSQKKESLRIYSPPILNLKAGSTITTKDGEYTPQKDEVWHSDARFKDLENQLIYFFK